MEKLIITVAGEFAHVLSAQQSVPAARGYRRRARSNTSMPSTPAPPSPISTAAARSRRSIQADGKMVSHIHHADWKKLHDAIMSKVDPIMQSASPPPASRKRSS